MDDNTETIGFAATESNATESSDANLEEHGPDGGLDPETVEGYAEWFNQLLGKRRDGDQG